MKRSSTNEPWEANCHRDLACKQNAQRGIPPLPINATDWLIHCCTSGGTAQSWVHSLKTCPVNGRKSRCLSLEYAQCVVRAMFAKYHHKFRSQAAVHILPDYETLPRWWSCSPLPELPPLWAAELYLPIRAQFRRTRQKTSTGAPDPTLGFQSTVNLWCREFILSKLFCLKTSDKMQFILNTVW